MSEELQDEGHHWRIDPITAVQKCHRGAGWKHLTGNDTTLVNRPDFPGDLNGPIFESQVDDANALEVDRGEDNFHCDLCNVPVRMYDCVYIPRLKFNGYERWAVAVVCPDCSRQRVWLYSTKREAEIRDIVDYYLEGHMTEYGLEYSFDQFATEDNIHEYLEKRDSRWYNVKRTVKGALR